MRLSFSCILMRENNRDRRATVPMRARGPRKYLHPNKSTSNIFECSERIFSPSTFYSQDKLFSLLSKKKSNTKRSKSFHIKSKSELPALKLRLPGKKSAASGSDSKHYSSTIEESNSSCEHLDEAATTNVEAKKRQPRKRRKSLVNLLFPAKNNQEINNEKKNSISCSNQLHLLPTDPEDTTSIASNSGGQRLHFRRLSEILVSKKPTSSQTKSKDDCNYNNLGTNNADLSNAIQVNKQIPASSPNTAASSQFIHKFS